jgi:site-specific DNA-methyltransferase (adenine-specific)
MEINGNLDGLPNGKKTIIIEESPVEHIILTEDFGGEAEAVVPNERIVLPEKLGWDDSAIYQGDAMETLEKMDSEVFQAVITSPPYWGVRDYGVDGQIGLEETLDQYLNKLVSVFGEVKRVLKRDGSLWLNVGDTYTSGNRKYRAPDKRCSARFMPQGRPDNPSGLKNKDLVGLPWRIAFALQNDGWFLRCDIIWYKPNVMPESVKDRPIKSHEYIFLLTKSEKYYYDYNSVMESAKVGQRGLRSVWTQNTVPFPGKHHASFPIDLIKPCIIASSHPDDFILDPFFGSGTVGLACQMLMRKFVGIELNGEYAEIASSRLGLSREHIRKVNYPDINEGEAV